MRMDKKTIQAIMLGALLLSLVVVAVITFMPAGGGQHTPAPLGNTTRANNPVTPPPQTAKDSSPKGVTPKVLTESAPEKNAGVTWLDLDRVAVITAEVAHSRNPFVDVKGFTIPPSDVKPNPTPTSPKGTQTPIVGSGGKGGKSQLPPFGPSGNPNVIKPLIPEGPTVRTPVTLTWLSVADVQQKLKDAPSITVEAGKQPNQVIIVGPDNLVAPAVTVVKALDVPPPPPPFILTGVIVTDETKMAMLSLDGRIYRVTRGQTIPRVGWTVTEITANSVSLSDGRRQLRVMLSGGSQI
jgi:type IV pilus biogenesis protein PilP